MITFDRDIVFLDCETLGLDRTAPIWEFAAIRLAAQPVSGDDIVQRVEFFVRHDADDWLSTLPESFADDYRGRYNPSAALTRREAAGIILGITNRTIIAGSNPSFDMERLERLLRANGVEPGWHYHPLDIPSMVVGQVARSAVGAAEFLGGDLTVTLPWNSNQLSRRLSVDPDGFARHTAMGDVQWCLAQWRQMNGVTE